MFSCCMLYYIMYVWVYFLKMLYIEVDIMWVIGVLVIVFGVVFVLNNNDFVLCSFYFVSYNLCNGGLDLLIYFVVVICYFNYVVRVKCNE